MKNLNQVNIIKKIEKMSTVNQDEHKAIKVLNFRGKADMWDLLQGYSWVQRRLHEQMNRLIEKMQKAVMS